jgi:lysophospholipase L1-like esterase
VTEALTKYAPNVILLVCGTNDIMQEKDLADAPNRLNHLVGTLLDNDPGVTVYVGELTPLTKHDPMVVAFNAAVAPLIAARAGSGEKVKLVDMYSILDKATDFSPDHIHPNASGYAKMAKAWFSALGYALPAAPVTPSP